MERAAAAPRQSQLRRAAVAILDVTALVVITVMVIAVVAAFVVFS